MSKILIVEDEVAIAELEKDYLELSGFDVVMQHTGDAGLKAALNEDFNLIILDGSDDQIRIRQSFTGKDFTDPACSFSCIID